MIGRRSIAIGVAMFAASAHPAAGQQLPRIAIVAQGEPVATMALGGDPRWDAFLQELQALGHVEGQTIAVERWTAADQSDEGIARFAAAVVATGPDVIVTAGLRGILAFGTATTAIPIVAGGTFPNEFNLAHPGGNITGMDASAGPELFTKHIQFLADAAPGLARIAWLGLRDVWESPSPIGAAVLAGAERLGIPLAPVFINSPAGEATIRSAMSALAAENAFGALIISPDAALVPYRHLMADLALAAGMPAIGLQRGYAEAGLLMAYGPDLPQLYRHLARHTDQILDGADPGELPIEQAREFDFVVNLRTAAALGITMPPSTMLFATEVIE